MTNPVSLPFSYFLCSLTLSNTSSFLTWSVQLIFSILLQYHISKLSRYFWEYSNNIIDNLVRVWEFITRQKDSLTHKAVRLITLLVTEQREKWIQQIHRYAVLLNTRPTAVWLSHIRQSGQNKSCRTRRTVGVWRRRTVKLLTLCICSISEAVSSLTLSG